MVCSSWARIQRKGENWQSSNEITDYHIVEFLEPEGHALLSLFACMGGFM